MVSKNFSDIVLNFSVSVFDHVLQEKWFRQKLKFMYETCIERELHYLTSFQFKHENLVSHASRIYNTKYLVTWDSCAYILDPASKIFFSHPKSLSRYLCMDQWESDWIQFQFSVLLYWMALLDLLFSISAL